MSLSPRFPKYLQAFGKTVGLTKAISGSDGVALRHDVDRDFSAALEMASLEHELGFQATYFVLPQAAYWLQDDFLLGCQQLQEFGHEIGLHLDWVTEWFQPGGRSPADYLRENLDVLRNAGIRVFGASSHGSVACYQRQVVNYWAFADFFDLGGVAKEAFQTAEGPLSADSRFGIRNPSHNFVERSDGSMFRLGSLWLRDFDLEYEAWHIGRSTYFTDSGGRWDRSPDPLETNFDPRDTQVLMHPEHWRSTPKFYLILSSPRSGSKWLAGRLNRATNVSAQHERILNMDFEEGVVSEKNTSDLRRLVENGTEASKCLLEFAKNRSFTGPDTAEVDVYVGLFPELVRQIFPDAVVIHLRRERSLVVESLLHRGWFRDAFDRRYPLVGRARPEDSRRKKVEAFVKHLESRISEVASFEISMEYVSKNPANFARAMESLGILVYPALLREGFFDRIDPSELTAPLSPRGATGTERAKPARKTSIMEKHFRAIRLFRRTGFKKRLRAKSPSWKHLTKIGEGSFAFRPSQAAGHGLITMGGSGWTHTQSPSGWKARPCRVVDISIETAFSGPGSVRLFLLCYSRSGLVLDRREIGSITHVFSSDEQRFVVFPGATRFDVALYFSSKQLDFEFSIERFSLVETSRR